MAKKNYKKMYESAEFSRQYYTDLYYNACKRAADYESSAFKARQDLRLSEDNLATARVTVADLQRELNAKNAALKSDEIALKMCKVTLDLATKKIDQLNADLACANAYIQGVADAKALAGLK